MKQSVLQISDQSIQLIGFELFDPNQIIVIKYGFGVLILDSKTPRNKKQIYEVQLENYLITDEWARALIKRACHQKNNAFVVIKNQFYVHNLNINLPDDYTVDIE